MKTISPYQFSIFRMILALYLMIHFLELIPWSGELFSHNGFITDGKINLTGLYFPNILNYLDSVLFVQVFVFVLFVLSGILFLGWNRRLISILIWYGWACLYHRNNFIANPGLPFIGWIFLSFTVIPQGEPWSKSKKQLNDWEFPRFIFLSAWILLSIGYTASGIHKLGSPSWLSGEALFEVLKNPLARPYFIKDILISMPFLLKFLTWGALIAEVSFCIFAFFNRTRFWIWLTLLSMHVGILLLIDFADLTWGIIMFHFYTFDSGWIKAKKINGDNPPIIFFDGVCSLCNKFISFLFTEDQNKLFRVATLQGKTSHSKLDQSEIDELKTVVLLVNDKKYYKSDAVLETLKYLGGLWTILSVLRFVPKKFRDSIYEIVAKNRYSIFGKLDTCRLPTESEKNLFLS